MERTQEQNDRRNKIIKDIIKKRPDANGCTYEDDSYFDHDRNYRRIRQVPSKKLFGYDPLELTTLGLLDSGYALRESICQIYDKGQTQKINRFHDRISNPLRIHIRSEGIPGLYTVRTRASRLGYIYAHDLDEAQRVADVTYGFTIVGKLDRWGEQLAISVNFNRVGTVADLNDSNKGDVQTLNNAIKSARAEIERNIVAIKDYEQDLIAIQMSELSQLSASFEESAA
tara:strand:- start:818 stop:1501 length:684 start_codon:yes stop_codon:yes gene_type:complete